MVAAASAQSAVTVTANLAWADFWRPLIDIEYHPSLDRRIDHDRIVFEST